MRSPIPELTKTVQRADLQVVDHLIPVQSVDHVLDGNPLLQIDVALGGDVAAEPLNRLPNGVRARFPAGEFTVRVGLRVIEQLV